MRHALASALLALGSSHALAVDLIFDASPGVPIASPQIADNSFWVGVNNPGVQVDIAPGGSVTVLGAGNSAALGMNASSNGNQVTVTGPAASLHVEANLHVGYAGAGNVLSLSAGADAAAGSIIVGGFPGATLNAIEVSGGFLNTGGELVLGYGAGDNDITVSGLATLQAGQTTVGLVPGASGNTIVLDNSGMVTSGVLYLGYASAGNSLTVSNSGVLTHIQDAVIGAEPGADDNEIVVTGLNSMMQSPTMTLYVGRSGNNNALRIENQGSVVSKNARIGGGSGATGSPSGNSVTVDNGVWNVLGTLRVGAGLGGTASHLDIVNGGMVQVSGNSFLGYDAGSDNNTVRISGVGSQLNAVSPLVLGKDPGSTGNTVTVADGGLLTAPSVTLGDASGVVIGEGALAGNVLTATPINGLGAGSFVRFNHAEAVYAFPMALSGVLGVEHNGPGTTQLLGSNTYTGPTRINAGVLSVISPISSSFNSMEIAGTGTLSVQDGIVADVLQNYTQSAGATLRTRVLNDAQMGRVLVSGSVTLAPGARIEVQAVDCTTLVPGQVLTQVIQAATPFTASSITVIDNCPLVNFVAQMDGSATGLDLRVISATHASVAPVPTLAPQALGLLGGLMGLGALWSSRRRKV